MRAIKPTEHDFSVLTLLGLIPGFGQARPEALSH
jgi:hypothetical protein